MVFFKDWLGKKLIIFSLVRVWCILFIKFVGEVDEDGFVVCLMVLVVGFNVVVINVVGIIVVGVVDVVIIFVLVIVVGVIVWVSVDVIIEDDMNVVLVVIVVEVWIDIGRIVDVVFKIKILVMFCKLFFKLKLLWKNFIL